LKHKGYHSNRANGTAVGIDVGATLAKIAIRTPEGATEFTFIPAAALGDVAETVEQAKPDNVGMTGGGAADLARLLSREAVVVNEFAAWGAGSTAMLREQLGQDLTTERHLVVSVGTGTSVMLVDGLSVTRVGGTALGGGTVVGLGSLLTRLSSFSKIAELAATGRRGNVDLRVSDIYRAGEIPLSGDLTAASFGKLLRAGPVAVAPDPADLAHALMGLVGENIALICGGLAAATQVSRMVFGGSTLRANPALVDVIREITRAIGREPIFLAYGEHAGALGALLLADAR
jgi:type II pantothenate kinase